MSWVLAVAPLLHFAVGIGMVGLAVVTWRHRDQVGGTPILIAACAVSSMAFLHGIRLVVGDADLEHWLFRGMFPLSLTGIISWVYLALEYTESEQLDRPAIVRVFVFIVALDAVGVATDPIHRLYTTAESGTVDGIFVPVFGPAGLVNLLVSVLFFAVGVAIFVQEFLQARGVYRKQTGAIIGSALIPMSLYPVQMFGPEEAQQLGLTVFGFGLMLPVMFWVIFYADFFEVPPIARKTLMESMEDAVVALNADGRVVDVNPTATELLDIDQKSVGRSKEDVFADVPELLTRLETADETETKLTLERDGQRRHYDLKISPISSRTFRKGSATAETVGHIVVLRDITERERQRRQLQEQNERLDRFAGIVSHDLRNPLNVAKSRAKIAQEREELDHLEPVIDAHERMERIIEDMLTLVRSTGDISVEDRAQLDIEQVATTAWDHVDTDGATLNVDGTRTVEGEEQALFHVFENLFRNALDHNEPPVTVSVGPLDDREGFYVEDDGRGIPEAKRTDIFEHGYTDSQDGTGFGLSIVEQMVDAHGWDVSMTAGADGGARFEIVT
jgi:PAS domain S-box-containing protein